MCVLWDPMASINPLSMGVVDALAQRSARVRMRDVRALWPCVEAWP